jgi:uncharacterized protein YecT (DUF1311 family)
MRPIRTAILAAFLAAPTAALADNCDQGNLTGFDSVYCFSKVFLGEDARLNENYATLRAFLSSGDRATLRDAQRGWIAQRDRYCMVAPTTVNVDCALRETQARADFLQARITECRTVGCATSRLRDY